MDAKVYNIQGKETGKIKLPATVFGVPWNDSLMHQVVVAMQANARAPLAHTKGRSEVRGGGAKPWRQKGTGRARHGSIRSPLWRGGGVTFGPQKTQVFAKEINKKMRRKALFVALSRKMRDNSVLFIDEIPLDAPKTAEAKKAIAALSSVAGFEGLGTKKRSNALIVTRGDNETLERSFNNFGNITVTDVKNLNPVVVLQYTHIIFVAPNESIAELQKRAPISVEKEAGERSAAAKKKTPERAAAKKKSAVKSN